MATAESRKAGRKRPRFPFRGVPLEQRRVAVLSDLKRVARRRGQPDGFGPSIPEYRAQGRYSEALVKKVAGVSRWSAALDFFGLKDGSARRAVDPNEVRRDVRRVAALAGDPRRMPTVGFYREHGRFGPPTVMKFFGVEGKRRTWAAAALSLGLENPRWTSRELAQAQILVAYRQVADRLGCEPGEYGPSGRDFEVHSRFTPRDAAWHFGTFNEMVRRAGFRVRVSGDTAAAFRVRRAKGQKIPPELCEEKVA